jgi:hypothetical protein
MVCALLKAVTIGLGLTTHTYQKVWDQTVALSITNSNRQSVTLVNSNEYLSCFQNAVAVIGMKFTIPDMEKVCEDFNEDDDDDEEEEEKHHHSIRHSHHIKHFKRPKFNPEKRREMKNEIARLTTRLLSSGGSGGAKHTRAVIQRIQKLKQAVGKQNVLEFIKKQKNWRNSEDGKEALEFCRSLGAKGNALKGCMQDMRLSGDEKIVKKAVKMTQNAANFNKKAVKIVKSLKTVQPVLKKVTRIHTVQPVLEKVSRIHTVQPRLQTVQRISQTVHLPQMVQRVQQTVQPVRKTGQISQTISRTQTPSNPVKTVVQPAKKVAAVVRKVAHLSAPRMCTASGDPHFTNFNGDYFHLQEPAIFTFAKSADGAFEVQVKQDGATRVGGVSYVRAVKVRYNGVVYTSNMNKDGFIVRQDGTTLSVTVPPTYENGMTGICGTNSPVKGAHNFRLPDNTVADVDYGKPSWEMGGYGGPNTKLSRWHLAWKPSLADCLFSIDECKANLGLPVPAKARVNRRRG